jgi:hypothetical protein
LPRKAFNTRNTSWPTSSHGRHGGDFIRVVEKALHREDLEEVQKFLEEQFDQCARAEKTNPILKNRRKKEDKAAKRKVKRQLMVRAAQDGRGRPIKTI